MAGVSLYKHQEEVLGKLKTGSVLCGGTGSGKSRAALAYYYTLHGGKVNTKKYVYMKKPRDLYIITTAQKRDKRDWEGEMSYFLMAVDPKINAYNNKIVVDSWNNISKYSDVKGAFFIFDEQRVVGTGAWSKAFIKIARGGNDWILLSATPGDNWMDYLSIFIANGFYKNKTQFELQHVMYKRFSKFPQVERYFGERHLEKLRDSILVDMPFPRDTVHHNEDIFVPYDRETYIEISTNRWNVWTNKPIKNASQFCQALRKVVNTSEARSEAVLEVFRRHRKVIVFYNYNYELALLRALDFGEGVEVAEWNGQKHEAVPDCDSWVYLVQYTAGAEGWNCITTNCIVFYSLNYSYKIMEQAKGRIDRLNTPYTDMYYYYIRSKAGIDLGISRALKLKKKFNERKFASK